MSDIDQKIKGLFEKLAKQREEVEKAEKESKGGWLTNQSLKLPGWEAINISTSDKGRLVFAVSKLISQRESLRQACEVLDTDFVNDFNGYPYESWIADVKKRIAILEIKDKKQKLAALEKRLEKIESPEEKRNKELSNIMDDLED